MELKKYVKLPPINATKSKEIYRLKVLELNRKNIKLPKLSLADIALQLLNKDQLVEFRQKYPLLNKIK